MTGLYNPATGLMNYDIQMVKGTTTHPKFEMLRPQALNK